LRALEIEMGHQGFLGWHAHGGQLARDGTGVPLACRCAATTYKETLNPKYLVGIPFFTRVLILYSTLIACPAQLLAYPASPK